MSKTSGKKRRGLGPRGAIAIPMVLHCPNCGVKHVDADDATGAWATSRLHHKHLCKPSDGGCGKVWQPSHRNTVGVGAQFVPAERVAVLLPRKLRVQVDYALLAANLPRMTLKDLVVVAMSMGGRMVSPLAEGAGELTMEMEFEIGGGE